MHRRRAVHQTMAWVWHYNKTRARVPTLSIYDIVNCGDHIINTQCRDNGLGLSLQ